MADVTYAVSSNGLQELSRGPSYESRQKDYTERIEAAALRQTEQTTRPVPIRNEHVIQSHATSIGIETASSSFDSLPDIGYVSRARTPVTFHALQEWEGYVLDVTMDDFTARLMDLTTQSSIEEEEAVIPLCEISDEDIRRMKRGSIFRWVIGYENKGGTKRRVSQIVFRDLPVLTKQDMDEGNKWAEQVVRLSAE